MVEKSIVIKPYYSGPAIIHNVSETNSSFRVELHTTGKVYFLFFKNFMLVLTKFLFGKEGWALAMQSFSSL